MGASGIVNAMMFSPKLSVASSEPKSTKKATNNGSFRDVLASSADSRKTTNKHNSIFSNNNFAGGCTRALASFKGQVQGGEPESQQDETSSLEEFQECTESSELQAQQQTAYVQAVELLQMIFNMLKSDENFDTLDLKQIFENALGKNELFDLQKGFRQFFDIDMSQCVSLGDILSGQMRVLNSLQSIILNANQEKQKQNILYLQSDSISKADMLELLQDTASDKDLYQLLFGKQQKDGSGIRDLRDIVLIEGENEGFTKGTAQGTEFLNQILKKLESIFKEDSKELQNSNSSKEIEIDMTPTGIYNKINSSDDNKNKEFSLFFTRKQDMHVDKTKEDARPEVLDLRQHVLVIKDGSENVINNLEQSNNRVQQLKVYLVSQVAEKISVLSKQNVTTLHVSIKPEWLGNIVIELSRDSSGRIFGNLIVTSAQVKELLEGSLNSLLTILKDQGINISQLNVSLGGNTSGQQYHQSNRYAQRRDVDVQGSKNSASSLESLIYDISEGIVNLRA